jgi:hypothetical protein
MPCADVGVGGRVVVVVRGGVNGGETGPAV